MSFFSAIVGVFHDAHIEEVGPPEFPQPLDRSANLCRCFSTVVTTFSLSLNQQYFTNIQLENVLGIS